MIYIYRYEDKLSALVAVPSLIFTGGTTVDLTTATYVVDNGSNLPYSIPGVVTTQESAIVSLSKAVGNAAIAEQTLVTTLVIPLSAGTSSDTPAKISAIAPNTEGLKSIISKVESGTGALLLDKISVKAVIDAGVVTKSYNFSNTNTTIKSLSGTSTPTPSCAVQPNYANTVFTVGTPVSANTAWQNSNSSAPCYYTCGEGYVSQGGACVLGEISARYWRVFATADTYIVANPYQKYIAFYDIQLFTSSDSTGTPVSQGVVLSGTFKDSKVNDGGIAIGNHVEGQLTDGTITIFDLGSSKIIKSIDIYAGSYGTYLQPHWPATYELQYGSTINGPWTSLKSMSIQNVNCNAPCKYSTPNLQPVVNCSATNYSGYTIAAMTHGQSQVFTKSSSITNGNIVNSITGSCINGTVVYGTESINTVCNSGYSLEGSICEKNGPSARYWRILATSDTYITSSPFQKSAVFYDIQLFTSSTPSGIPVSQGVVLSGAIKDSKVNDGGIAVGTHVEGIWASDGTITIFDLGSSKTIRSMDIYSAAYYGYTLPHWPATYELQYGSTINGPWTTLKSFTTPNARCNAPCKFSSPNLLE